MIMPLFWVLAVVGIFLLVRGLRPRSGAGRQAEHPESPLEILKRRYAKGDIDKAEFEQKNKDLTE